MFNNIIVSSPLFPIYLDIFGLLPREPIGLSKEPKEICVSHQLLTPIVQNGNGHSGNTNNGDATAVASAGIV